MAKNSPLREGPTTSEAPNSRGFRLLPQPRRSASRSRLFTWSLAGIVLVLNARILLADGVPVHGDLTYPWLLEKFIDNYLYLFTNGGSISNLENIDRLFLLVPALLAGLLGQDSGFVHKILFLLLPLVSMFSMVALLRFVLARVNLAYDGPSVLIPPILLYAFSPWVVEQFQAYLFWMAYSLTPLLLLLAFRFFERPNLERAAALAVLFFFLASTPHYLAYSLLIVAVIGTAETVYQVKTCGSPRGVLMRLVGPLLAFLLASLIFNFYWIFPTAQVALAGGSIGPGYEVDPASISMFSQKASPLNVARGYDQWVYWFEHDSFLRNVLSKPYTVLTLVPPVLGVAALFLRETRRSRHFVILAYLAAGFGLVSLGTRTPILEWLTFDAPVIRTVGWIFRVPGKLSYMLWPFYCVGLALILGSVLTRQTRKFRLCVYAGASLMLAMLLLPKTVAYFYHYYVPIPQPTEYAELEDYLEANARSDRVLYLAPYDGSFGMNDLRYETSFTWNPRRVAAATPVISSPVPSIGYYHLTYRDWQRALYPLIYPRIPKDIGARYLSHAGVRYLIYHNDIVGGGARGGADLLRLHETDLVWVASFGFIHVFENPQALPVIRAAGGDQKTSGLRVWSIDPATYRVELTDAHQVNRLLMAQPFDPLWVLKAGDEIVAPRKAGALTMRFDIPPSAVREGTIEYLPQRYYRQGIAVSTIGLGIISVAPLFARFIRHRKGSRDTEAGTPQRDAPHDP